MVYVHKLSTGLSFVCIDLISSLALYFRHLANLVLKAAEDVLCPSLNLFIPSPDGRCDVSVPVHEALHSRGNVQAPSGLLQTSSQQLLRLLRSVPPSRRLGRTWSQSLLHLLRGLTPDELL